MPHVKRWRRGREAAPKAWKEESHGQQGGGGTMRTATWVGEVKTRRLSGWDPRTPGRRVGAIKREHNKSPAIWAQMAGSTSHLCAGNNDLPASCRRGRVDIHEEVMRQVCKMTGVGSRESDEGRPNTQYKHTHTNNQGCGGTNKLYWEICWGAATDLTQKMWGLTDNVWNPSSGCKQGIPRCCACESHLNLWMKAGRTTESSAQTEHIWNINGWSWERKVKFSQLLELEQWVKLELENW